MNRLSVQRVLLASAAFAAASAATAQVAAPPPEVAPAAPAAAPATTPTASRTVDERFCLRETGSLIRQSRQSRRTRDGAEPCLPVAGRAYTADDLRGTGQVDVAQALRRLDPSIR